MKLAIIDDNIEFLKQINSTSIKSKISIKLDCFNDTNKFIKYVEINKNDIDGVLIDIVLDEANGLEIAEKVHNINENIKIIYVTGYVKEYCQNIFTNNPDIIPFSLLTKPLDENIFFKIIEMLHDNTEKSKSQFIKVNSQYISINPEDICYIESVKRYVNINMIDSSVIEAHGRIKDFSYLLTDNFLQSHQNYYVNIDHIKSFDNKTVTMKNGQIVSISQTYHNRFKSALLEQKSMSKKVLL